MLLDEPFVAGLKIAPPWIGKALGKTQRRGRTEGGEEIVTGESCRELTFHVFSVVSVAPGLCVKWLTIQLLSRFERC